MIALVFALAALGFSQPTPSRTYVIDRIPSEMISTTCRLHSKQYAMHGQEIKGCLYWGGGVAHVVAPNDPPNMCVERHEIKHFYQPDWHAGRYASPEEGCDFVPPEE